MFSTIAVINLTVAATQFVQVAWISRAYGADNLAMFALVAGVFAPVLSFLSSGQRFAILARGAPGLSDDQTHRRLRHFGIVLLAVSLIGYAAAASDEPTRLIVLASLVAAYRLIDSSAELNAWVCQRNHDKHGFIRQSLVRIFAIWASISVSWLFSLGLTGFLLVSAVVCAIHYRRVGGAFTDRRVGRSFIHTSAWKDIRRGLITITPIGIAAAVESLCIVLPRYYLASAVDLEQVAEYVVMTQLAAALGMVGTAKLQTDMPIYAKIGRSDHQAILRTLKRSASLLAVTLLAVGFLLSTSIVQWILAQGLGRWILESGRLFGSLPYLAALWFVSGYVANVCSVITGERWLFQMSLLVLGVLTTGLIAGEQSSMSIFDTAVMSLLLAFGIRLIASTLRIYGHLKPDAK